MKLAFKMEYMHPVREKTDIEMIPYTPNFQERYKALYNECYREMRTALHVAQWNQRALRLYESMGFEVTETIVIGQ